MLPCDSKQQTLLTCGSSVGKNLQFIGKTFLASTIGVPGSLPAWHSSRVGLEQARSQSSYSNKWGRK